MKRDLNLLTSTLFLAALSLLLANDFLLKPLFHNALTGKLSDFAGLFAFPFFWSALAPRRRRTVYALTALGFAFWKSPYAQPLIDGWNELHLFNVGRTVDPTDLIALIVLPLSDAYLRRRLQLAEAERRPPLTARRFASCAVLLLSVFAFTATQTVDAQTISYDREYRFRTSKAEVVRRLYGIGLKQIGISVPAGTPDRSFPPRNATDLYTLRIGVRYCNGKVAARVEINEVADLTLLKLHWIEYRCDEQKNSHKQDLLGIFEREVIEKLIAAGVTVDSG